MKIHLSRDSVCAGDDGDAPHEKTMTLADGLSAAAVLSQVANSGYLASITGGKATWSAATRAGRPLAVLAQQWAEPKLLPTCDARLLAGEDPDGSVRLHFRYHQQEEPDAVYASFESSAGSVHGS